MRRHGHGRAINKSHTHPLISFPPGSARAGKDRREVLYPGRGTASRGSPMYCTRNELSTRCLQPAQGTHASLPVAWLATHADHALPKLRGCAISNPSLQDAASVQPPPNDLLSPSPPPHRSVQNVTYRRKGTSRPGRRATQNAPNPRRCTRRERTVIYTSSSAPPTVYP
jgi:hypothetical protein